MTAEEIYALYTKTAIVLECAVGTEDYALLATIHDELVNGHVPEADSVGFVNAVYDQHFGH